MLNLDYRDARPIYEQVRDGLRRLMVTGVIREGEKLPSVRALASSLAINPNTIQRAYESLEAEGYVCSVPGKGSFAAPNTGVDQGRRDGFVCSWRSSEIRCIRCAIHRQRERVRRQHDKGRRVFQAGILCGASAVGCIVAGFC